MLHSLKDALALAKSAYKRDTQMLDKEIAFFWLLYALVVAVMELKNERLPFDE
jgi:hypothetical protein